MKYTLTLLLLAVTVSGCRTNQNIEPAKSVDTVENNECIYSCDFKMPVETQVEYSECRRKYAVIYRGELGTRIMRSVNDLGYCFYEEMGGDIALFNDSCSAKYAFSKYLDRMGDCRDFKRIKNQ